MIKEKIKKLLAVASSTSSVEEAELAFSMAQRLLEQHNLSMAEIEATSNEPKEKPVKDDMPIFNTGRLVEWKRSLATGIAKLNNCMNLKYKHGKRDFRYYLIGRQSDIDNVRFLVSYIILQLDRLALVHTNLQGASYRNAWFNGAVAGVLEKMRKAKMEVRAEASSTALMSYDNRAKELDEFAKSLGVVTYSVKLKPLDSKAYNHGREVGSNLDVNSNARLANKRNSLSMR